jgi:cell division protein FtsI (penicillin-binding protein 3)
VKKPDLSNKASLNKNTTAERNATSQMRFEGSAKVADNQARSRLVLAMILMSMVFTVICGRLVYLGFQDPQKQTIFHRADTAITASRPDLIDRNGKTLATDIHTASLYAEPNRIIDPDEALELLITVLPELNQESIHNKLSSKAGFVWLQRELTPSQQSRIFALGIPGIGFKAETRRFYPNANTAAHIVGHVNIDNVGIAGIEKYVDDSGLADLRKAGFGTAREMEPFKLSIDIRVQHFVRDELAKALDRYQAIAAGAVVLNIHTGEVVAMSSLPDYDPNKPADALKKDNLNRISAGLYEMGSTFKSFTTAMALDSGKVVMEDKFDATKPLRIAGYTINDFHAKRRWLNVPDIFIYSSNIGTALLADRVGIKSHQEFLSRLGLLDRMTGFELPEVAKPQQPKQWRKINSVTISYGHGVTTTPLQTAAAAAALLNGGKLIPPTLLPRNKASALKISTQVITPRTSDLMRYLYRLNVEKGSGKRSEVKGYRVGGKTGTAEKVVNGKYVSDKRFNVFLAGFPIDKPQYVVMVFIDEPKPEKGEKYATAGMNAAPIVARIIGRSAPLLGVKPKFMDLDGPLFVSY